MGVVHIDLAETKALMLQVVQELVVDDNLLRPLYKTQLLVIQSFNNKVYNNFDPVILTKKIMMNLKKQSCIPYLKTLKEYQISLVMH